MIYFLKIMLDPAALVYNLFMRKVTPAKQLSFLIKQKSLRALGTLIDSKHIFTHMYFPLLTECDSLYKL